MVRLDERIQKNLLTDCRSLSEVLPVSQLQSTYGPIIAPSRSKLAMIQMWSESKYTGLFPSLLTQISATGITAKYHKTMLETFLGRRRWDLPTSRSLFDSLLTHLIRNISFCYHTFAFNRITAHFFGGVGIWGSLVQSTLAFPYCTPCHFTLPSTPHLKS